MTKIVFHPAAQTVFPAHTFDTLIQTFKTPDATLSQKQADALLQQAMSADGFTHPECDAAGWGQCAGTSYTLYEAKADNGARDYRLVAENTLQEGGGTSLVFKVEVEVEQGDEPKVIKVSKLGESLSLGKEFVEIASDYRSSSKN